MRTRNLYLEGKTQPDDVNILVNEDTCENCGWRPLKVSEVRGHDVPLCARCLGAEGEATYGDHGKK